MPQRKLVVTGANGFIGANLCLLLKAEGWRIAALDINPFSSVCDEIYVGDLSVEGPWSKAMDGADTVFHLAGKVHALTEVKHDDAEYFRINTEGTRNLLKAAERAKVKRFVFFSTIKAMSRDGCERTREYENARQETEVGRQRRESRGQRAENRMLAAFSEEDLIEPDTPYGRSKLEAEKLVLNGGFVPEPVVLRLCMVYGAGAKGNIQKMLQAVSNHRFPPVPEVGNRRSMVHVSDVIRAAVLAAEHPAAVGEVFIVSDGQTYSTRQMYDLMCRALGRTPPNWSMPLWGLRGLGHIGDQIGRLRGRRFVFDSDALEKLIGSAWYSSAKIEQKLGFKPEWILEKAMPEMVAELKRR
jgi:nucleoside-diphosphate-sugar epimerase